MKDSTLVISSSKRVKSAVQHFFQSCYSMKFSGEKTYTQRLWHKLLKTAKKFFNINSSTPSTRCVQILGPYSERLVILPKSYPLHTGQVSVLAHHFALAHFNTCIFLNSAKFVLKVPRKQERLLQDL